MSRHRTRSELDRDPPIAEQGVLAAQPENHSSDWAYQRSNEHRPDRHQQHRLQGVRPHYGGVGEDRGEDEHPPRLEDGHQESDGQGRGRTTVSEGAYLFLPGLQALRLLANG